MRTWNQGVRRIEKGKVEIKNGRKYIAEMRTREIIKREIGRKNLTKFWQKIIRIFGKRTEKFKVDDKFLGIWLRISIIILKKEKYY